MFDVIGTVLDRLQGLLGRRYLIVGVGPLLIFAVLSLPLLWVVWPDAPYLLQDLLALSLPQQVLIGFSVALLLGGAGFLLLIANAWWRQVLERGGLSLEAVRKRRRDLENQIKASRGDLVQYRLVVPGKAWFNALAAARAAGLAKGGRPVAASPALAQAFEQGVEQLENGRLVLYTEMQGLFASLGAALNQGPPDPELNRMQVEFATRLAPNAWRNRETDFGRLQGDLRTRYPSDDARVVRSVLGNIVRAHQDQIYGRYGMNLEVFWPALETLAGADKERQVSAALDEAQTRLDFTVSMNAVLWLLSVLWLVVFLVIRVPWYLGLGVGIVGPATALVFYQLTIWNTHVFHSWVRTTVELYRLPLLKQLHIAPPADSDAERDLWVKLTQLAELGQVNVGFTHP